MARRGSIQGRAGSQDLVVAGWIPINMLDWDGRLATTVFVAGCNFSCPFCHNPELVSAPTHPATIPLTTVEEHLALKAKWLDGVVLSGGEPTLSPDIFLLARRIKQLGVGLKLDTNGSKPDVISQLIEDGLVDCVAMDVKAGLENYPHVVRRPVSVDALRRSIDLVISSGIPHEFRTTLVPGYVDRNDALNIAEIIAGGQRYALQQFNPSVTLDPEARDIQPYSSGYLRAAAEDCSEFLPTIVRGIG
ncbi:MAG: anaerobic ribonucleoside-triphosphate reductase activating protein [Actinobacteria bacterium]|nr:MAG: anaerobic ribonucleoside-triphosphate reductase activating protein [Actinomycetota bacterium]